MDKGVPHARARAAAAAGRAGHGHGLGAGRGVAWRGRQAGRQAGGRGVAWRVIFLIPTNHGSFNLKPV